MNTKYTGPIKEVEVVEKTVLTAEQAHEFEAFKKLRNSLEDWAHDKSDPNATYSIIHELTFDEMARAYLIGYEIEPEQPKFQPGDKVINVDFMNHPEWKSDFKIALVKQTGIRYGGEEFVRLDEYGEYNVNYLRHATPEEIFWLETLGRENVGDFREGDIYIKQNNDCYLVGSDVFAERALDWYVENDDFKGLHPAESFRPFKKEPE